MCSPVLSRPPAGAGQDRAGSGVEGLGEVSDEVVGVFEADRQTGRRADGQTDHAVGDAALGTIAVLGEVGEVGAVVGGGGEEFVSQDAIDADVSMLMFNVFGRRFLAGPLS
ncbi:MULTISPECIES: hypothetical protein [unclassified Streptomyces]|uniref:hypothetical protein n=1 Tax=unclassified Streptomyces TaxID=2593676 RepID=UPI00382E59CC